MDSDSLASNVNAFREYKEFWPVMMKADLLSRRATRLYDEIREFNLKWHHTIYDASIKKLRHECMLIDQEIELLLTSLDISTRNQSSNPIASISSVSISTSKNLNCHTMKLITDLQKKNINTFIAYSIPIITALLYIFIS